MNELFTILLTLSDPDATHVERGDAAARLPAHITWLAGWLKLRFGPTVAKEHPGGREGHELHDVPATVRPCLGDPDIELVVEHVKDQAMSGRARFRGDNGPPAAIAWVKRIARNKAIDVLRHKEVERRSEATLVARARREEELRAIQRARAAVQRRVKPVLDERVKEEAGGDPALLSHVEMAFELVWTTTTSLEQVAERGYVRPGESDPATVKRADDLAAQHRRRARKWLAWLLHDLVDEGKVATDDADVFAPTNRLPWPPSGAPPAGRRRRS